MLCALTTPSPEVRTDFGAIDPLIVWINLIVGVTTSAWAGVAVTHSETSVKKIKSLERTC